MIAPIIDSWQKVLSNEFENKYFQDSVQKIEEEYESHTIYPPRPLIFNAFNQCSFEKVKVVILGQDPYHGTGQAMGLSFSVPEGLKIPPSLRNIYKEISTDLGVRPPSGGNLENWARQGVLLLNSVLTVRAGEAGSHRDLGWEQFTDAAIHALSAERRHLVFLLWGAHAIKKAALIDESKHLILTAPHPSPLSAYRGFFGCRHFSKTNEYLKRHDKKVIVW